MIVDDDELSTQHLFDGERCDFCGVNMYDIDIYPGCTDECVPHPLIRFTTETPPNR